jgi:hypothetical protein
MSADHLTGRCLCGAVRYQCGAPVIPACFCHCESCRRTSGAHVVAWATVRRDTFRVVTGTLRAYASSPPVIRQFCDKCGSSITYSNQSSPDTIDVTVTTLDSPDRIIPVDHIWMEDALSWDRPQDGRPQYPRSRQEPQST